MPAIAYLSCIFGLKGAGSWRCIPAGSTRKLISSRRLIVPWTLGNCILIATSRHYPCLHDSASFEKLHGAFVSFGRSAAVERPEIAPAAGPRILLARVEAILTRLELLDHLSFLDLIGMERWSVA
jgi:hypothetical protein